MKIKAVVCTLILGITGVTERASAQISLTGTNYTQNFDNISSGLPAGWSVRINASVASLGTAAGFVAAPTSWTSSSGQFANFASTTNNDGTSFLGTENASTQTSATNRCPGIRQTGSFGDPDAAFVLQIQNTLGLANFQVTADFSILNVQGRSTTWTVDYGIGTNPVSFTSIGTFTDPGTFGTATRTLSFGSALDNQGQNVWIRVVALTGSTGSGSRDTFGIDNFALSYGAYVANTNPPAITAQPQSRTNSAGTTASFAITASGGVPLTYRWKRNNTDLSNGTKVAGADTPALTLSDVFAADAATYTVAVSNSFGFTVSSNAVLTVIDPIIATQPLSRTNLTGDTASFSAAAVGTSPLHYQWRFNGSNIPAATGSSLSIANLQATNQGDYSVTVSNATGIATSTAAHLTLLSTPATRLVQWDFNATNILSATAPAPSIGNGTASLAGDTTGSFSFGSSSDPDGPPGSANSGWNTSAYPSQGTSNKLSGVQFNTSTIGYQNLLLTWEQRNTTTASKYARLQFSTDGTNFADAEVIAMGATNSSYVFFSSDLSGTPGINNNSNFAFRIVTEFESSAIGSAETNYVPTSAASSYTAGGTIRFDLVNVFANPLAALSPIPLQIQLAGTNAVLTWSNPSFALQGAATANGAYTNIPGATSPYTNPANGPAKYFRLKAN
jgi:Immunoglobulin I-set domain